MPKRSFSFTYQKYRRPEELPQAARVLLEAAGRALHRAYAPYSSFKVGAAVLLKNGEIMRAGNQENAAYPMCLCAERVVLGQAHAAFPQVPVTSMAITCQAMEETLTTPITPCGACRQVIHESERRFNHPIELIMRGEAGPVMVLERSEFLLPFAFG